MIACEKCSLWQHIACLQKSGQIGKGTSLDDINFICHKCEDLVDIVDEGVQDEPQQKRQKIDTSTNNGKIDLPLIQSSWQQPSAVRAEPAPPIHSSSDHITPPAVNTAPILPNLINNTTNANYVSLQALLRVSPTAVTPNANVGQPNCTAQVQSNPIQSPANPIVNSDVQPTPIVTAPSVPTIEATAALEEI